MESSSQNPQSISHHTHQANEEAAVTTTIAPRYIDLHYERGAIATMHSFTKSMSFVSSDKKLSGKHDLFVTKNDTKRMPRPQFDKKCLQQLSKTALLLMWTLSRARVVAKLCELGHISKLS